MKEIGILPKFKAEESSRKEKTEEYWTSVWSFMAVVVKKPEVLSVVSGASRKVRVIFKNDTKLVWNQKSKLHVISDNG